MTELDPQWKKCRSECYYLTALFYHEINLLWEDEANRCKAKTPVVFSNEYYQLKAKSEVLSILINQIKTLKPGKIENNKYIPNLDYLHR